MAKNEQKDTIKSMISREALRGIIVWLLTVLGSIGLWLVFFRRNEWIDGVLDNIPIDYLHRALIIEALLIIILTAYIFYLRKKIYGAPPFVASYHRPTYIERIENDFKMMQEEIDRRKREGTDDPQR